MLRFSVYGIPVGVHATFLFIALIGSTSYRGVDIALWTAAAFLSILLHEMGHALVARLFGASGVNVTLYGLGGVTNYSHSSKLSNGRSFVISAAGSAAGIVAGGTLLLLVRSGSLTGVSHEASVFIDSFIFTALVWGVLNWIPIIPLDGGHMVKHLAGMVNEEKAALVGQVVTWITVAVVVPLAISKGFTFAAVLVVIFAVSGLREYRAQSKPRPKPPIAPSDPVDQSEPPQFPI